MDDSNIPANDNDGANDANDANKIMETNSVKSSLFGHFKSHWFPYLLALCFLLFAGYSAFQNKVLKSKFEADQLLLNEQVQTISNDHLRLTGKTFSWAVRSAMQRDNYDQVREYFHDFIREKKINTVALSDNSGNIIVCTDMNYEGELARTLFKDVPISQVTPEVQIYAWGDKQLVETPILALNERLGTLYWAFTSDSLAVSPK